MLLLTQPALVLEACFFFFFVAHAVFPALGISRLACRYWRSPLLEDLDGWPPLTCKEPRAADAPLGNQSEEVCMCVCGVPLLTNIARAIQQSATVRAIGVRTCLTPKVVEVTASPAVAPNRLLSVFSQITEARHTESFHSQKCRKYMSRFQLQV